jgi:hypothetical protein
VFGKAKQDGLRHPALSFRAYRIYGEEITDLLPLGGAKKEDTKPELKYSKAAGTFVHGVKAHLCKNLKMLIELYEQAVGKHLGALRNDALICMY